MVCQLIGLRLKVVLWKNCMIRKHHLIQMIIEIALPLVLFLLLASFYNNLSYFKSDYIDYATYAEIHSSTQVFEFFEPSTFIYYAPQTDFTSQLIKSVQTKLKVNDKGVKGLSSETALIKYYATFGQNKSVMGVVFRNVNRPNHLKYVLKPSGFALLLDTEQLFSINPYIVDTGSAAYFDSGVISMQMALDMSYMELVSKKQLPVNLTLQEFPYPPHNDDLSQLFQIFLPFLTVIAFILLLPFLLQRVIDEKITGIKELMKMMGLKSWMLWLGWFLHELTVNLISIFFIVIFLKVKVFGKNHPILQYCSGSVYAVFLMLYSSNIITFTFLISSIFNRTMVGVIVGIGFWIVSSFFRTLPSSKLCKKVLHGIVFPNKLLSYGYNEISNYETREVGVHWSNLFVASNGNPKTVTMGLVFVSFIIASILHMVLTLYIESIKPGPYGLAKPFYFPFSFIWRKLSKSRKVEDVEAPTAEDSAKIEKPPKLPIGISTKNLYKKYGSTVAVNNFSINIYEGQITALLGHNGAGKTTTMSIITGMTSATSGKVLIYNKDIKYHLDAIRCTMGFCPQSDLHFRDLNVEEHLILFAMLKGSSHRRAKRETADLLHKINLSHKRYNAAGELSGGMKRKLSLGMAIIGNSKVLILDEPTSGLDPESRREIWDILLTFRGSRIVLITTHFMEEADVLGDRIAIMDHGQLMCYGTSMYLKKEYGAGYNLTIVRNEEGYKAQNLKGINQVVAIVSLVQGQIKTAKLLSASGNQIVFLLPHNMKPSFGALLEAVENKKEELFITNIAVSVTTMEEVFLKVDSAGIEHTRRVAQSENEFGEGYMSFMGNPSKKQKGRRLEQMQLYCLINKRLLVLKRKWFVYVLAVAITIAMAIFTLHASEKEEYSDSPGKFDYVLSAYGNTTVFYGPFQTVSLLEKAKWRYKQLIKASGSTPKEVASVPDMILMTGEDNMALYHDFLIVAAEFKKNQDGGIVNAMHSFSAIHSAPIALNVVTNTILKTMMHEDYGIFATIAPLPSLLQGVSLEFVTSIEIAMIWILLFPLGILCLSGSFVMFPHMERVSNVKQLQLMCGVRAAQYWYTCYMVDFFLYLIAVVLIIIGILIYGLVRSNVFSGKTEIDTLMLILLGHGMGAIPYVYLFSYKKTAGGGFVWYFCTSQFLTLMLIILTQLIQLKSPGSGRTLEYVMCIHPFTGLNYFLFYFSQKAVWNHNWDKNSPDEKMDICEQIGYNPCCDGDTTPGCINYKSYVSPTSYGANYYHIIIMTASSILYFAILLLLESSCVQQLWDSFIVTASNQSRRRRTHAVPEEHDRTDVLTESDRISDLLQKEKENALKSEDRSNADEELLLVHQLEKRFKLHRAVKGVSFAVKPGECFGLLGVNGAGKTTTFRILTGNLPLITGEARILTPDGERFYLSKQSIKFLQQIGYCPQYNALNEALTGREMLQVFAELRGISEGVDEEINMYIRILGLEEIADKRCGHYSGGNKRKLCVAVALVGGLPIVMLDEPTSGVDPASRHKLWDTLAAIQRQDVKPSIVLTSHSMEECEALCNNLVIMKGGLLQCYGTIPNIKKKYALGFTVMLKLQTYKKPEAMRDTPSAALSNKSSTIGEASSLGQLSTATKSGVTEEVFSIGPHSAGTKSSIAGNDPSIDQQSVETKASTAGKAFSIGQQPSETKPNTAGGAPSIGQHSGVGKISSVSQRSTGSKSSRATRINEELISQQSTVVEDSVEVKNLMAEMETKYKGFCVLKDKHQGLLHYHITDKNKKWGQIFREIEELQHKHPIIEDYNISEATLEQVFLTIARGEE